MKMKLKKLLLTTPENYSIIYFSILFYKNKKIKYKKKINVNQKFRREN